ncbi:ATP-binding protein [Streptomyces sp. NPDC021224]|uniref:ATP-binding protein n=1 Tax=unclassified Streptomyces TaxID=2593676 RepID=UPI0037900B5A
MRTREPQPLGQGGALERISRILAARGIAPGSAPSFAPDDSGPHAALAALSAGLPPRYRDAEASQAQVLEWVQEVVRLASPPGPGARPQVTTGPSLLLAGVTGSGKTYEAYGAIRALARAGLGVRWRAMTAADMYASLRPRAGADSEAELAGLARSPLLLLDDLGAAKTSEWVEEITYRLVNRRYNLMLPTLVTTNLPIADLRAHLGDRVTSRLAQMTTRISFAPVDRRRARA